MHDGFSDSANKCGVSKFSSIISMQARSKVIWSGQARKWVWSFKKVWSFQVKVSEINELAKKLMASKEDSVQGLFGKANDKG